MLRVAYRRTGSDSLPFFVASHVATLAVMQSDTSSPIDTSASVSLPLRAMALRRVTFSLAEAAIALGTRPNALRRLVERHSRLEGAEHVARLSGGIVARKRQGMGRWVLIIPADLRGRI